MDDHRYSTLSSGITEVLVKLNATKAERSELFSDAPKLERYVETAHGLLSFAHATNEKVAMTIISEAREIFGAEAAQQLIDKLGSKFGGASS